MSVFQRGKTWYIGYSHNGQWVREAVGPNKTMAKKALEIRKAEIVQGKYKLPAKKQRILFRNFAEEFLNWAREHRKPRSAERYESSLRQLTAYFGSKPLVEIHPFHIESYKSKRGETVSGSTINRDLACLKRMFSLAVKWGRAEKNPVSSVEFFKEPKEAYKFLNEEEASRLVSACDSEALRLFVILGLHCGLRYEEMLSLKWSSVNLKDRIVIVEAQDSKNSKVGEIPMTQTVYDLLSQSKPKGDYVICRPDGGKYQNFRKSWKNLVNKADLPDCNPHVLRHTFATELVRSGADLMAVKELGRWSSLAMVQRYAHVSKDHRTRIIHLLDHKFVEGPPKSIPNEKRPEMMLAVNY